MDSFSSLLGVGSLNFANSPDRQDQSTQGKGKQRKRQRTSTGTPPMSRPPTPIEASSIPSADIGLPNSSRPNEVGSSSQVRPPKIVYEAWTDATQAQLFEWLELPSIYHKWKCAGIQSSNGSSRSSALTKKAVTLIISAYLDTLSTRKSPDQVMNKMRYVEKKFKEAEDFLRNTGKGLTSNDKKLGITKIRDKVSSICPFYFQVKSFMSETVSINPPYIGETRMEENIADVLFGSPTTAPAYGCAHEGEPYDNDGDENSSSDEEAPFDGDITGEQEPLEENILEGNDSLTTPLHKTSTFTCWPKFELRRHELQQKYSLKSRRLDLEYKRMEHLSQEARNKELALQVQLDLQRQESRNYELALQLELEKLRCTS